jgi:hypothetical protein
MASMKKEEAKRAVLSEYAIRTEPVNPRLRRTAWWGWEDSNFQPNDYQPLELNH